MKVKNKLAYLFTWLLISVLNTVIVGSAHAQQLSDQAKVSLITIGPGDDLYSGFGHSAIWIYDPLTGIDRAYNYGTFSFETGNFYIKFLRGTLPYSLSVAPLEPQLRYWQSENRYVKEQILNFSPVQKENLYAYLENNYKPENREYQYLFFYDNCSTRLRDAVVAACGDSLVMEGYTKESLSFRQWIDRYAFKQKPWADFGMDLAIGSPADEIATAQQATFLPENLLVAFDEAKLKTGSGEIPLVSVTNTLYEAQPFPSSTGITPMNFFWGLMILVAILTYFQDKNEKVNFLFDKILFTIVGITGWILLLLWVATNHGETVWNSDLLWAIPLWFPLIYVLSSKKEIPEWFPFILIFYAFLVMGATLNLDKHNQVIIPILSIIIMRIYYINESIKKLARHRSQSNL